MRLVWRLAASLVAVLLTIALGEAALRVAGPAWLRARMQAMAAGVFVVGDRQNPGRVEERRDGAFLRFTPGASFGLVDTEFQTTVHIGDLGTRVTGTESARRADAAFL